MSHQKNDFLKRFSSKVIVTGRTKTCSMLVLKLSFKDDASAIDKATLLIFSAKRDFFIRVRGLKTLPNSRKSA